MIKSESGCPDMAECSKCGKSDLTFTCKYCGEKFCSEHRLPENHDCENINDAESRSGENEKWFKDRKVSEERIRNPDRSKIGKPSLLGDVKETLKSSVTLSIIAVTVFSFLLQSVPGYENLLSLSPALTQSAVEATNQVANAAGYADILETTLLQKPWSILTVMLTHGGTFHLFANMVTFYFFGRTLEKKIGRDEMLKFYAASGIASSLAYVAFRNVLFQVHGASLGGTPLLISALGASGAVVAVFGAVAMLYPDAEVLLYFFIPMKIRTALYLFTGFEVVNMVATASGVTLPVFGNLASSAHLAGLACGVWYGRRLRKRLRTSTGVLDLFGP